MQGNIAHHQTQDDRRNVGGYEGSNEVGRAQDIDVLQMGQVVGADTLVTVDLIKDKKEPYHNANNLGQDAGSGLGLENKETDQLAQVMNSSRSDHSAKNQDKPDSHHHSKTAQGVQELSSSRKSSVGKHQINSGSDSNQVGQKQLNQFNQKKRGSVRHEPSIGSRDNSKGKKIGVTSRGPASDDGQMILSSQSQYDSQNSKDNGTFSNKAQKQLLQGSTKDATGTVSS